MMNVSGTGLLHQTPNEFVEEQKKKKPVGEGFDRVLADEIRKLKGSGHIESIKK